MEPIISFIITYHNEPEDYLISCLESIQALPLSPEEAEIIVVDDGSEVPPTYAGKKGFRFIRQEQAGLSVARNTGIKHSRGEYLQFVDADDYIFPSAYEAVLEQIRSERPDVVMFKASDRPSPKEPEKSRQGKAAIHWRGRGSKFLQRRNLRAAAWGYAFRREALGDMRFSPGLLHEDELFTPQLFLRAESLVELDVKAYFYRQHEGTITSSKSVLQIHRRLDDIHFILCELRSLDEPLLKRRIRQLTVDYLQKIWSLTRSLRELRRRKSELKQEGFLPLPLRAYSFRYFLASLMF